MDHLTSSNLPMSGPNDSAREAITAFLRKYIRVHHPGRPRSSDLPDSVHQMRVAARRLRSGLKAFGPLVDEVGHPSAHRTGVGRRRAWSGARHRGLVGTSRSPCRASGSRDAALVRAVIDPQLAQRLDSARDRAIGSL